MLDDDDDVDGEAEGEGENGGSEDIYVQGHHGDDDDDAAVADDRGDCNAFIASEMLVALDSSF